MNIELSKGVNLSVDISDAMIKDYTECQKLAKQNLSNTGCCQSCSMDSDILGYGLCEIPVLVREIKAMQKKRMEENAELSRQSVEMITLPTKNGTTWMPKYSEPLPTKNGHIQFVYKQGK